ncbi:MAG: hypothetical protein RAM36_07355 [Arsenophonus sp.]|nr:hypothetical protein [Arsenophonus sp.]
MLLIDLHMLLKPQPILAIMLIKMFNLQFDFLPDRGQRFILLIGWKTIALLTASNAFFITMA